MMQAVILAAGEGRRVRPLTKNRPKAMIPVANRPIIEYVIDALVKNGIRDIIVVVGYRKELVTRYLNNLEIPVEVVVQNKQLGTGHALLAAEPKIRDNFIVLPGDNYIDPASIARIRDHSNAMLVKEHPSPSNFGVVILNNGHVTQIIEKPAHAPSFLVSTGIYSLTKDFFPHIRENNLTDAVSSLIASGVKIQGIPADDWQDAIYPWDLLKMNRRFLQNIPPTCDGTISRYASIHGAVQIGKGTTIGPNTVINGPVVIGNDCRIGPNCCIQPNTSIGSRVVVEPFTVIGEAIVMDDTTIGSHSRVIDTILGERCKLADHLSISTVTGLHDIEGSPTRSEFGAVLGDSVTSGPFSILKNTLVGNNVTIEGNCSLSSRQVQDNSLVI